MLHELHGSTKHTQATTLDMHFPSISFVGCLKDNTNYKHISFDRQKEANVKDKLVKSSIGHYAD